MYQDDPEVKCAIIKAAANIVMQHESGASMNQETADAANAYLQEMFTPADDSYEDAPNNENDDEPAE